MTLLITICTEKVTRDFEFCGHENASDIFYVVLEEMISEYSYWKILKGEECNSWGLSVLLLALR